jgi:hypothetical protein
MNLNSNPFFSLKELLVLIKFHMIPHNCIYPFSDFQIIYFLKPYFKSYEENFFLNEPNKNLLKNKVELISIKENQYKRFIQLFQSFFVFFTNFRIFFFF